MPRTTPTQPSGTNIWFYEHITEMTKTKLHELREAAAIASDTPLEIYKARAWGVFILWHSLAGINVPMDDYADLLELVEEDWPVCEQTAAQ